MEACWPASLVAPLHSHLMEKVHIGLSIPVLPSAVNRPAVHVVVPNVAWFLSAEVTIQAVRRGKRAIEIAPDGRSARRPPEWLSLIHISEPTRPY